MTEKRLFLLDAYALIYRAYYALMRNPRVTSQGLNTSAVFGFLNTLEEVLRKENPTHIAACFDPAGGHTFRHELFADYKAGRDKQPEDITIAIPYIKRLLEAYRIPVVEIDGYEADDVIGTLSRMAEAAGFTTYMMTPDKDYGQLVTDHVLMYRPPLRGEGFEIRGPEQVTGRYGIGSPRQVIDLLALEGDKSDNIPGCPGIGEKGAAKLIQEWGSVENLIANVNRLKGATQKKISENAPQILFSKELATIRTDVPLPPGVSPETLVRHDPDYDLLLPLLEELEFRTFIQRINRQRGVSDTPAAPAPEGSMGSLFDLPPDDEEKVGMADLSTRSVSYATVTGAKDLASAVEEARRSSHVGLSVAVTGASPMEMRITAVAFSASGAKATCVLLDSGERDSLLRLIRSLIEDPAVTIVSHDVKTTMILFHNEGFELTSPYFDTSIAHYLLEPEINHRLATVASKYLGYSILADETLIPSNATARRRMEETGPQPDRLCEQADICLQLVEPLSAALRSEGLMQLFHDIELPMARVLADMEISGVRINSSELHGLSRTYTARLHEIEQEIFAISGRPFNIGSPTQVGEVLFDHLKIDAKAKRTKRGAYSTTEEILQKLSHEHPICRLILDYRGLRKLLATYIDALPSLVNPRTGKIHTTYNQTVTSTGRISSTNPNLQNIPVRSEDGREIRRAFIPDPGNVMLSADYSQIELRLVADISGDENMIEAFREGNDIHRATAAKIYHLPLSETPDDLRRNAKTANFGIIYGISAFGLSERLGIPRSEAKELIEGYFRTYPGIRGYMDRSIALARDNGYVSTIMGRRRWLPDINSRSAVVRGYAERNAINAPIQGSAADIIKRAMIDIHSDMRARNMRSRMIMQVHDELIFNVVPDELPELQRMVTDRMEHAYSGRVALEVSSGVGQNWLEAH